MSEGFDWSVENEDVIVPEQRSIAVYANTWGQAVIRQERAWDEEEDIYVVVDHAHLPALISALMKLEEEAPGRDKAAQIAERSVRRDPKVDGSTEGQPEQGKLV